MTPVSYLQTDARWRDVDYSAPGEKRTIGSSGCGPTCAAMLVAAICDPAITPKESCAWAKARGYKYKDQGTAYSFFKAYGKEYGLDWYQLNGSNLRNLSGAKSAPFHQQALEAVRAGHAVICCMGPGLWTSGGHYILWYREDGGEVHICDPNSQRADKLKNTLLRLQSEVKYYFICKTPEGEIDMTKDEIKALVAEALGEIMAERGQLPAQDWPGDEYGKAVALGITDGTRPQAWATRQEVAVMTGRAMRLAKEGETE